MKKLISMIMVSCILFGTVLFGGVSGFAVEVETEEMSQPMTVDVELDYSNALLNDDGTVFYDILNVEELAEALGVAPENVRQMKFLSFPVQGNNSEDYGVSPAGLFSRIEIQNVVPQGQVCWHQLVVDEIVRNDSSATVTRTKQLSATVSHTYTTNVETGIVVDGATLGSALGFSVTDTVTVTDTISIELEPGEAVEIIAVPLCQAYSFDVYQWKLFQGTSKVGEGMAYQAIGLCVTVYDI